MSLQLTPCASVNIPLTFLSAIQELYNKTFITCEAEGTWIEPLLSTFQALREAYPNYKEQFSYV